MNYGIYLLLGTNQGDREANLRDARERIGQAAGSIERASAVYRSAAWGVEDQPDFYNQALRIASSHSPEVLLEKVLAVELEMGRIRRVKWGPRLIDIDILLYGDEARNTPLLRLPHPGMPSRRFVLVPLSEIGGEVMHPVLHKKISILLAECTDPLWVTQVSTPPLP